MNLNKLKEKLIKEDKEFTKEYYKDDLAFGIARLISNVRAYEKIDQTKLAKILKTKQSGISRIERGNTLPSLTFVNKIAKALNYKVQIRFISNKTNSLFDSDGMIDFSNKTDSYTLLEEIKSPYYVNKNYNKDQLLKLA